MNELSSYIFSPLREGNIALYRGSGNVTTVDTCQHCWKRNGCFRDNPGSSLCTSAAGVQVGVFVADHRGIASSGAKVL